MSIANLALQVFIDGKSFDIVFGIEGEIMNKITSLGNHRIIKIDE